MSRDLSIEVQEIINLASKHKLIPFLGAGASFEMLGVDWNIVRDNLAKQIQSTEVDPIG